MANSRIDFPVVAKVPGGWHVCLIRSEPGKSPPPGTKYSDFPVAVFENETEANSWLQQNRELRNLGQTVVVKIP